MFISTFLGRSGRWAMGAALVAALVSGCGGGGGNDAPAAVNTPPVTTMLLSGMVEAGGSGADVSANTGGELILSGSSSADANGDALTYKWSITSKPATSALVLAADTAVKQTLVPDVAGIYVITLRVTDSKGAYSEKKVTILVRDNAAPVTNVVITAAYTGVTTTSPTQSLNAGAIVVLDARGSKDADGDVVTTSWTLLEKPSNSLAGLTVDGAVSRFVTDLPGLYKVRAHGVDERGAYSDTIYVFNVDNTAPQTVVVSSAVAPGAAGNGKLNVNSGYIVSLDGYGSYDMNGGALSMAWSVVSKPTGSNAVLSSATGYTSQIIPDLLGEYVVKMSATNSAGALSSYLTTITVNNRSPFATISTNAAPAAIQTGPAVRLPLNTAVTLRGAGSVDADGDTLTYAWSLTGKPAASAAALSATTGATVQMTTDLAGSYVVLLRVTDPSGAFSEKSMTFQAGTFSPVAVTDKSFATVLVGGTATVSGAMSFDDDSTALTYAWAVDSAPAGSGAAIAAPSSPALSFTPDLAGNYVLSLTVSDGVHSNIAYVTVRALSAFAANVELAFAPLESRYSKGLDKLVILATNPNTVKIVDSFTGLIKTVLLPFPGKSVSLSPNGKLAVVMQEGIVSLVDLEAGTLLHSTSTDQNYSEALVNNGAIVQLLGRSNYNSYGTGVAVIDGRTGVDLTSTLGSTSSSLYGNYRGVYSGLKNRTYLYASSSSGYMYYADIDALTGKVGNTGSSAYNYDYVSSIYLSENDDLLFTSSGAYYRTDTLVAAGRLSYTGMMQSLSHSAHNEETLVMSYVAGSYPDYNSKTYQSSYKRYVGALFQPDTDLTLPLIAGQQSYGIQIYHSSTGKQVALVQTVTSLSTGAGAKFYVLTR
ncbi:PKD domain-containing protein [Massilia sp. TSP1-1-2]|uniref:PKD domain-containing protein n=1 Tax=Massilia sp. TSP1-1-2 TaxID=2804649 RepID=UPI003CF7FA7F